MPFSKLSSMLSFPLVDRRGSVDATSLASGLVESSEVDEVMPRIASFRMSVFNCTKDKNYVGKIKCEPVFQDDCTLQKVMIDIPH